MCDTIRSAFSCIYISISMGLMQSHITVSQFHSFTLCRKAQTCQIHSVGSTLTGSTLEMLELVICYVGGEPNVTVAVTWQLAAPEYFWLCQLQINWSSLKTCHSLHCFCSLDSFWIDVIQFSQYHKSQAVLDLSLILHRL